MLPKDKYTIFDRKEKRYRKGIHSMWDSSLSSVGFCVWCRVRVWRLGVAGWWKDFRAPYGQPLGGLVVMGEACIILGTLLTHSFHRATQVDEGLAKSQPARLLDQTVACGFPFPACTISWAFIGCKKSSYHQGRGKLRHGRCGQILFVITAFSLLGYLPSMIVSGYLRHVLYMSVDDKTSSRRTCLSFFK